MEIGAIAQILEHVTGTGKGGLTNPGYTFSSHLGKGIGPAVAFFPGAHIVTADTAQCPAVFRNSR